MNPKSSRANPVLSRGPAFLFDFYLLAAVLIFLTGAEPFIHGPLKDWIQQKPWIHRTGIAVFIFFALAGYAVLEKRVRERGGAGSWWAAFFSKIRISPWGWTWVLFFILSAVWTFSSWIRHEVFQTGFDMAIFVQAVWNTLHGHFLYSSIKGGICLLGDHVSPILALLAFPYAAWPDPKCLLLIQAVAVASSVFPLFLIAKQRLQKESVALAFVLCFALYLPVRNSVRFDFHPELLVMPALFWAYFLMREGKRFWSSFFVLISFLGKENVSLVIFILGCYAFFFVKGARKYGIFWMVFSGLYFYLAVFVVAPHYSGQEYFYLRGNFLGWGRAGSHALFRHVFSLSTLGYLFKIFAPVGFLSFLSPSAFLLTLPILLQNLLAHNAAVRSIFFQYTNFLTPFVFISAVEGGARWMGNRRLPFYILSAALLMSGVSEYYVIRDLQRKQNAHWDEVKDAFQRIPSEASVRTHEFFAPHLAHRKELHIYENKHPREGGSAKAMAADYVVLDRLLLGDQADKNFSELLSAGYRRIYEQNGFVIFRRG